MKLIPYATPAAAPYFIGIDIGTNSIGWAVTDLMYKILRRKGKDLWGVREFDAAETAKDCRGYRVQRRRYRREKVRLGFLQIEFVDEIEKIDPAFFMRLAESKYYTEDKKTGTKFTLFNDPDFTDKEYFEQYPTIFHLRKDLIDNPEKHDIRLVYLAIANLYKRRGHFLNAGLSTNNDFGSIAHTFSQLMDMAETIEFPLNIDVDKIKEMEGLLANTNCTREKKKDQLISLFGIDKKDKANIELLSAICGNAFQPAKLFDYLDDELLTEELKAIQFSFIDEIEEKMDNLDSLLGCDYVDFLQAMKTVHDIGYLAGIMKSHPTLSHARVASYEKHKEDLRCLKDTIVKYCPEEYDKMFREMEWGSYSSYVNSVNAGKNKERRFGKKGKDAVFLDYVKKIIEGIPDCAEKEYILTEIANEGFLPKQLTSANAVIPNQVHLKELEMILANAERYLPFLQEKDKTGLSVSEKICQMFAFCIPYYVGPLKNTETNNAWVVRTDKSGYVFPWNLHEKVDLHATRQAFIENMIRNCTYIRGEKVLPKCSLLYEKFCVLNELNNLRINEVRLTVEQKQKLYNELFVKGNSKRVTRSKLEKYLIAEGLVAKDMTSQISGIDDDIKSTLSSYKKFYRVFGDELNNESVQAIAEDIIYWGSIMGQETKAFVEKIKENHGDILTPEQIKIISGFKFNGWGRMSKELLELPGCSKDDGEVMPLIDMMWNHSVNLMEVLSDRYTYYDELKTRTEEEIKTLQTIRYEDLDDMSLSMPVKRMVWQALNVIDEIVSVMGYPPEKIFMEMAREHGKKGKVPSRKDALLKLYKKCKKKDAFMKELQKDLESREEHELKNKKLYLYYLQQGRCMYTGKIIDVKDLSNDNLYDTDHIYARSYIVDNSIQNNLVLSDQKANKLKDNKYPIDANIQNAQNPFWDKLLKDAFITREKHKRLTATHELTDEQLAGFIMRQLVETRQGAKTLANILETSFGQGKVCYVKAGLVTDFRNDFKNILKIADNVPLGQETDDENKYYPLLKSRLVNNFHHAQDAYLNIVVGNAYHTKFTANPANFIKEFRKNPKKNHYHMHKVFYFDVKRNGKAAWIARGEDASVNIIKKMVDKNSPLITRMSYEQHGELFDATRCKAKSVNDLYIQLKESDSRLRKEKYGGYTSVTGAYYFLVEHESKGEKVRTLEVMPLYLKDKIGDNELALEKYCKENLGLINPSIRIKKIKFQSLLKIDGYYIYLSGRTGDSIALRNAVPLCLNRKWVNYITKVEKCADDGLLRKEISAANNLLLYDIITSKMNEGVFSKRPNKTPKFMGIKLKNSKENFLILTQEQQCKVLVQMLKLTTMGFTVANLVDIGLKKTTGGLKINKKLSHYKEVKLIYQSPAGMFEKELDLLTV